MKRLKLLAPRLWTLAAFAALTVGLVACGGGGAEKTPTPEPSALSTPTGRRS